LQNHLGDTEFPVRPRSRYAKSIEQWRRQLPGPHAIRALLVLGCALPFGAVGLAIALTFWPDGTELANPFFGGVAGLVLGLIASSALWSRWDAGAPRRAQRAYLRATGAVPITPEQQQILALDAASDYSFGGWNSSLAFTFAWVELPAALRAKWADGQKGNPWPVLPMTPLAQLRTALDRDYKIASATDVDMLVADLLAKGRLSQTFEEVAASPGAEAMASRVAAISGVTVFDVLDLANPTDGREPELLLAGDVERVIGGVRYAYLSGYVSADRAWELLERVAARAFDRYRSYDEYWEAVAIATAFRTDSLEYVEKQRANLAGLRENRWPAAATPFPERERGVAESRS
jgi:hypothetical protein